MKSKQTKILRDQNNEEGFTLRSQNMLQIYNNQNNMASMSFSNSDFFSLLLCYYNSDLLKDISVKFFWTTQSGSPFSHVCPYFWSLIPYSWLCNKFYTCLFSRSFSSYVFIIFILMCLCLQEKNNCF